MFTKYVAEALKGAKYEPLEDGTYFATIPGFQGLWGNHETIEGCREDLRDALEGWLLLKLWDHDDDIPVIGKLSLYPRSVKTRKAIESRFTSRARKAS